MITQAQYEVLKIIFKQRDKTPYYGIIAETGIWPYKDEMMYKKRMSLHHLVHSSEERIAKKILNIE